jgi:hypothetical protein
MSSDIYCVVADMTYDTYSVISEMCDIISREYNSIIECIVLIKLTIK